MSSRHGDSLPVISHHLPQKDGSGKHWKPRLPRSRKLRIVGMDSCRVHHGVNLLSCLLCLSDVFCPLSDIDHGPSASQMLRELALFGVRACDGKSLIHQNLRQATHADASDSHKINVLRFIKINLIHVSFHLLPDFSFPWNQASLKAACLPLPSCPADCAR